MPPDRRIHIIGFDVQDASGAIKYLERAGAGVLSAQEARALRPFASDNGKAWKTATQFAIPADKAGTLADGSALDVMFEAQGIQAHAVVRHVAPELDPIAQMIVADADLVDAPAQLQSGMVCRIVPRDAAD